MLIDLAAIAFLILRLPTFNASNLRNCTYLYHYNTLN